MASKKKTSGSKGRSSSSTKRMTAIPKGKGTSMRNSAIPKAAARRGTATVRPASAPVQQTPTLGAREVTHGMIARRAYEISLSGMGGSDLDNWCRAERELRGL